MTAEHSVRQVWTWGEGWDRKMSWACTCGYEPRIALSGVGDVHLNLRKSQFEHARKTRQREEAQPPVSG